MKSRFWVIFAAKGRREEDFFHRREKEKRSKRRDYEFKTLLTVLPAFPAMPFFLIQKSNKRGSDLTAEKMRKGERAE
ncbi:MAG: hypothetical protein ACXWV2_10510 [Chitinophagaceae bacterium]